jgi:pseudaminic acid biosynthesis-associated methylase
MTETEEFWAGEFGDEYTKRNRVDWRARIPFWKEVIDITGARSVLEFGCNAGWNLSAIKRTYPDVYLEGVDVNPNALQQAANAGLNVGSGFSPDILGCGRELVFTSGVLIHIAPENLQKTMQDLVKVSSDYVLAVEYEAEEEEEVEYRGHAGKLWKRPYRQMYESLGLKHVTTWYHPEGFDNCVAWLMRKP